MTITRRQLIAGTAAAILLPGLKATDEADPSRMIVRSPKPEDLEMPLDSFLDWITPVDRFFVRCHTYTPKVNLSEWSLKIGGTAARTSPRMLKAGSDIQFPSGMLPTFGTIWTNCGAF